MRFPEPVGYSTLKLLAKEAVVTFQGFDNHVVKREPDRAAPVGIATEHVGRGLGRFVVDAGPDALGIEIVGLVPMKR